MKWVLLGHSCELFGRSEFKLLSPHRFDTEEQANAALHEMNPFCVGSIFYSSERFEEHELKTIFDRAMVIMNSDDHKRANEAMTYLSDLHELVQEDR